MLSNCFRLGYLKILQYLHEHDFPWNENTCYESLRGGKYDCFKYAIENECPCNIQRCGHIIIQKNLYFLWDYIYSKGCIWHTELYSQFIGKNGSTEMIQWAEKHKKHLDLDTLIMNASKYGHLSLLKIIPSDEYLLSY